MKSLQDKLYECTLHEYTLHECPLYEGFYENTSRMVRPTTKEELKREIRIRLDRGQTNLNDIDTSKIINMNSLFSDFNKYDLSNLDISKWDVSNVKYMNTMFYDCTSFNSDLSKWDVSNVEYMNSMFYGCTNFNSDLSKWDVSKVENMNSMFYGCEKFNCDLSKWNVSRVDKYMCSMFKGAGVKKLPKWYENS